jgi:hypothetical protein
MSDIGREPERVENGQEVKKRFVPWVGYPAFDWDAVGWKKKAKLSKMIQVRRRKGKSDVECERIWTFVRVGQDELGNVPLLML